MSEEESGKRFEAVMKKLFDSPRHGGGIGKKRRRYPVFEEKLGEAPSCSSRPWDRSDLFRRLSTFKSMTWFAKPQVVSPLNCARRGWVNVDTDTIACTSCDARLLFSTPSVWDQQQVEKAAMVFSLKLETAHKLLCPWINNACTEQLAQFPILSLADLADDYKKRFRALSQLSALPVILPGFVRSPQLDQFLATPGYHVSVETPRTQLQGDIPHLVSSISYYQVQKLISLFGWEPYMLPYIVDFKDGPNQSIKDATVIVTTGQKQKISVYSLCENEGTKTCSEFQLDPCSVVLDCKLCGASVGLWAFCTIARPVEYLRFVGVTEVNGKYISTNEEEKSSSGNEIHTGNREGMTNNDTSASTSIAGGPPPAMLNYDATISLPVIGQSLRARVAMETETNGHLAVRKLSEVEDEQRSLESAQVTTEGTSDPREDEKRPSSQKSMEFNPIKQHRHFCPWIESNGKFAPGWQQTLSALEGDNELSFLSPNKSPSSTLIEVDDPVASVKKLFTSPNEKRAKAKV